MDDMLESLVRGAAIAVVRLPTLPPTVAEFERLVMSVYGSPDGSRHAAQRKVMALALSEASAKRPLGVATCLAEVVRLASAHRAVDDAR